MNASDADSAGLAIELISVEKHFGDVVAVHPLSVQIERGEFFSLLGPSGCGKTTTLRMLAGFEFPDSGSVMLHGRDVTYLAPNRRPVNLVFQRYELFPHMTVEQNVAYGLKVRKVPKAEIATRVAEMLEIVGVGDLAARRAEALSGGQQQRVALARALVNRPEVLLLDEPLSALDVKLRKHMQLELKSIQKELGTTFVYVTHDQEEAMVLSDRIGIMSQGRLLQVGTPEEIYEAPADPFVADFVGISNELVLRVIESSAAGSAAECVDGNIVLAGRYDIGSEVRVAVRPERIDILDAAAGPVAGSSAVPGTVAEAIYLGPTVQHVIDTPVGRMIVVESIGTAELREVGTAVCLTWAATSMLVLDHTHQPTLTADSIESESVAGVDAGSPPDLDAPRAEVTSAQEQT